LGFARFRADVARPFFAAAFVVLRIERFEDFAAVFFCFGAGLDFFAAAFLAGVRRFAADVFAFARRFAGWLFERFLRAAMTAGDGTDHGPHHRRADRCANDGPCDGASQRALGRAFLIAR
jgi:hypothetical protein